MDCSTPRFPVIHHSPELAQTHVHRAGDAIQLSRPLLSIFLLPSVFPSIRVFSNASALRIRWPKDWTFSINLSNEYSALISFRVDWFDLLAVQGTLMSLLQHHSSFLGIFHWIIYWDVVKYRVLAFWALSESAGLDLNLSSFTSFVLRYITPTIAKSWWELNELTIYIKPL